MASTITRWQPFSDFAELRHRLDQAFADLATGHEGSEWTPAIDVHRSGDAIRIRADIPGVKPEEIEIELADDVLTIAGAHSEETETTEGEVVRRERRSGAFRRSIALPTGVDADAIEATSHDGVLELVVPLPREQERKRVTITPKSA